MSHAATMQDVAQEFGTSRELGAHVVAATFNRAGTHAAFALGDGTLRIADLAGGGGEWLTVPAHDGAILCLAQDTTPDGFVCGGDDARFLRVTATGEMRELADFGSKWVEQAASHADAKSGTLACAAGKLVHLFDPDGKKCRTLEHPSTVTGLSFDAKGKRIAASHYNGASLWFVNSNSAPRLLEWKGSHTGVALHPNAEAVVTCMQENALHGWRLPDGHDMRMSGYPAKPQSISFSKSGKYLASSGADAVVLWPFFGGGPMGKPPLEVAQQETTICTRVAFHPVFDMLAAAYADGSVMLTTIGAGGVIPLARASQSAGSALAWSPDGMHLAVGNEAGWGCIVGILDLPVRLFT